MALLPFFTDSDIEQFSVSAFELNTLNVGENVKTPYGLGKVSSLSDTDVVTVQPVCWKMAGGQVPKFYMNRKDVVKVIPEDFVAKLKSIMDEFGFVLVRDVLGASELLEAEAAIGQDLLDIVDQEKLSKDPSISRAFQMMTEHSLVADTALKWPGAAIEQNTHGLPQGQFAWMMRRNRIVQNIYQILHDDEDLVCGMDQPFFKPTLFHDPKAMTRERLWGHTDQNYHDKHVADTTGWAVYQSIVNVWDSTTLTDWSTAVWPGSHKSVHPRLMADPFCKSIGGIGHFICLSSLQSEAERDTLLREFEESARRVPQPRGSMLVWDSRTVHQGCKVGKRLAMPVCWEPRWRRGEPARRRKLLIAASGMASTHWASLGNKHGGQNLSNTLAARPGRTASDPKRVELPTKGCVRPRGLRDDVTFEEAKTVCSPLLDKLDEEWNMNPPDSQYLAGLISETEAEVLERMLKPDFVAML